MPPIPGLSSLAAKALAAIVCAVLLIAGGAYVGYRYEKSALDDLKLADAAAMTKAVQVAADKQRHIDADNQGDAVQEAYFRGKMDGTVVSLKSGAPANVTILQDQQAAASDHAGCVTYGFVRLLVAGERLVSADSLSLPSGESVDSCTGLEPSELATEAAQDLAAGSGAVHQLNSLIVATKRNDAIATGQTAP